MSKSLKMHYYSHEKLHTVFRISLCGEVGVGEGGERLIIPRNMYSWNDENTTVAIHGSTVLATPGAASVFNRAN